MLYLCIFQYCIHIFSKLLVASICDLPNVVNLSVSRVRRSIFEILAFLSRDQQSGWNSLFDHLRMLTPNNLGGT